MHHYLRLDTAALFVALCLLLGSCENGKEQPVVNPASPVDFDREGIRQAMLDSIGSLESQMKAKGDQFDHHLAKELLGSYISYSNNFHEDTLSGDYLFRAASVADRLGRYQQAIELLINFYDGFPGSGRRAEAAYLVGFIYDAHLHNKEKAATFYQAVIDNHPGTSWAVQAGDALKIVYMSDEELIRFLDKKNSNP
jgi:tetratricopeptide (TPR) repeat protein